MDDIEIPDGEMNADPDAAAAEIQWTRTQVQYVAADDDVAVTVVACNRREYR